MGNARAGAAGVAGGGAIAPAPAAGDQVPVELDSLRAAAAGNGGGIGGGSGWSGAYSLHATTTGVIGGGAAGAPMADQAVLGGGPSAGASGAAWEIVPITEAIQPTGTTNVAVALGGGPAAPAPIPAAAPQVDMRRVVGTPQPGGVISVVLASVNPNAAPARSEGAYMELVDGNGARMQAHVHGRWASSPAGIADGIRQGMIQVHVHPDGTVHLHDVA